MSEVQDNTQQDTGLGLIFFNADGTCGGYVRRNGVEHKVRGSYNNGKVNAGSADGKVHVSYAKVERVNNGPVGRGTVTFEGSAEGLSVFPAKGDDGRSFHGLTSSELAAHVNAPF